MQKISKNWYSIYFCDQTHQIEPGTIRGHVCPVPDWLPVSQIIFQHQVHGVTGHALTCDNHVQYVRSMVHDGDYLITDLSDIAIGVLTADCLPIALVDTKNKAIGIVHAGWRGSVAGIACSAFDHMTKQYGSRVEDIIAYFGPCAHLCCYQVDKNFVDQLPIGAQNFVLICDNNYFFDLCACNIWALNQLGVTENQIDNSASKCTICNQNFCSYRRNSGSSARQMSIIWIH